MSLSINNNITALNAWRNLKQTDSKMSSTMEKLSSGLRINRGADDPAGLVISEKMRSQLTSINSAIKNSEKAINLIATAEAALDKTNELLTKMRQLVIDTGNVGVTDQSMASANQQELNEIIDSISRIAANTQFGTKSLLNGELAASGALVFQVGANEGQTVKANIANMKASALAADFNSTAYNTALLSVGDVNITSGGTGLSAIANRGVLSNLIATTGLSGGTISKVVGMTLKIIDNAIDTVSEQRGKLGAIQADNLQVSLDSLRVAYENLQSAESTIRDADMTKEMAEFTKYQIMMQAGTAMMAQANQIPQTILQLLQ